MGGKRRRGLSEKYELQGIAKAAARGVGAKEYVLGKVIPTHGLTRLLAILEESAGVKLPELLNQENPKHWPQIHSAFEVRHLIEHAKGKIDDDFLAEGLLKPLWRNSTWGAQTLHKGDKVLIFEGDFEETFQAMLAATDLLSTALEEFAPKAAVKPSSK